jgi:hypothetical protein
MQHISYAKVDGVITRNLHKIRCIQKYQQRKRLTSRETLLKRIIDTIIQRNVIITSELTRLNQ